MKSNIQIVILAAVLALCTSCVTYQTITPNQRDKYDMLSKLDNLRSKNVLTEEEFLSEKQKILSTRPSTHTRMCKCDSSSEGKSNIDVEIPELTVELTVCEQIEDDFNSLPQSSFDNLCVGHSTSFDYYSKLDKNSCGDFKKLIEISRTGYELECVNGVKAPELMRQN